VSTVAKESVPALSWRRWRDPAAWSATTDIFAILIAVTLPWSTTLVSIFAAALLVSMGPFLDVKAFVQSLKRPICALPIAFFSLAAVGTLWSDAPWGARLYAVGPTAKLLMLPVLLYHFDCSARGVQVLIAFLASCVLLMVMSWIVALDPGLTLKSGANYGVPVNKYIDQSQEFALCAVVVAYPVIMLLRKKRVWLAALLIAISISFVVNMMFVVVSRTALVTMPIMLAVFAVLHLKWRSTSSYFASRLYLRDWRGRRRRICAGPPKAFSRIIDCTRSKTPRPQLACVWNIGRNRCASLLRPPSSVTARDRYMDFLRRRR
jgi:O-antigen ligase